MYAFLTKNGQTLAFGAGLILVVAAIVLIFSGLSGFEAYGDTPERYQTTIFNFGMYAAIALIIVGLIAAVLFGIFQLATDPKGAIKGIIGLVAIIVLFFVFYSIADPNSAMLSRLSSDFVVTPGQSKFISGGITTALILLAASVLAAAVAEVINFFK